MFRVARPLRLRRRRVSRPVRPIPIRGPFAVATLALTLLGAAAIIVPANAQTWIHIGPFSFPNPFVRPAPPREGVWRSEDRPSHHHSASENRRHGYGGRRLHVRVRADLRRQFLSVALFGRERREPGGRVPGPLSQRRGRALYDAFRRHDRRGRVGDRRALLGAAERLQVPADLRPDLLLPAPEPELGGRARRGGEALWPQLPRHPRDRGGSPQRCRARSRAPPPRRPTRNAAPPPANAASDPADSLDSALDVEGVDTRLKAATAAVSRETSGIQEDQTNVGRPPRPEGRTGRRGAGAGRRNAPCAHPHPVVLTFDRKRRNSRGALLTGRRS